MNLPKTVHDAFMMDQLRVLLRDESGCLKGIAEIQHPAPSVADNPFAVIEDRRCAGNVATEETESP